MTALLRPPKFYIDTGHLISIYRARNDLPLDARFRRAYEVIDDCIRNRHFGLIFNMGAPIEWLDGNATETSAREIASVIDSAKLQYFYEGDVEVYTAELLIEAARQIPTLAVPALPTFQPISLGEAIPTALGHLAHTVPGYVNLAELPLGVEDATAIPRSIPPYSARDYARQTAQSRRRGKVQYSERVVGFRDALQHDIANMHLLPANRLKNVVDWMKRFLKLDLILTAYNPGIDIEAVLAKIDISTCPAVKLWFSAREKRIRAKHSPKENEVDDWFFLPVIPYADLVLTDRNFKEFIIQADRSLAAKVFSDPNDAVQLITTWMA